MNQGPILPNLLRYCIPMMLSGVLQLLFNAADISVAGQYIGDLELAAIGATATLINLLINLLVGLSVGVSVCLGRAYGEGEGQTVRRMVHNAMLLAAFCSNIALRLEINEVSAEIKNVKSQIAELDSEKTSLEVEMQRRISFSNLELEAVKLGMRKPTKDNITYIRVNDKNAAKISDGNFVSEE